MITALCGILALLAAPSSSQESESLVPISPCPNVFNYEPPGSEPGRWYGVVNLSTDSTLHSLWLNIVLDSKADILGNWIGDVTTQDNIDFKVENTEKKISPGPALPVRFFVQYNPLNKTPRLQAIRLNGREICNANTRRPADDGPTFERPTQRPNVPDDSISSNTRPPVFRPTEIRPTDIRPTDIRPEDRPQTRPVQTRPNDVSPVYVRPVNSPSPTNIAGGGSSQNVGRPDNSGFGHTTLSPVRGTTRRPRPDIPDFDNDNVSSDDEPEYWGGGQLTFIVPKPGSTNSNHRVTNKGGQGQTQGQCGRVMLNNPIPLVVNGTPTLEGQWPWQIALYQTQTVDNKYICGGTLVSHRHVITAAHCVTRKGSRRVVNQNTLTVYLGKHNLRTSVAGVQIRFVENIIVHPEYNATTFSRDLAILELREPVTYSDHVQPACLWPEDEVDLKNVIGKNGSVVGWGFDDTGVATEELSLVEMPVVDQETCIRSYSDFFVRFTSDYTFCAGYRNGVSVCNGDSGGGMVFKSSRTWYLRGLVSLSVARQNEYRCDPTHYVIFTDLAKFLPWIKQHVYDY
ncbi:serine proteinase stubble-like isoform X2 [Trichoplusia ni]|uniref:Serine proteinase stubble-like isoform X2 n=1 Tax=Trichoplusia ni TaxID=7111 RepID=A0A7E5WI42_TRINI|nr:serine proteinase stubble-like isoform X2 [Trichoplusia ni]